MIHKSGFVKIIGYPNVGKSTLINAIIGKNISIVTYKANTTRNNIIGILNLYNSQIIFYDTPGILIKNIKKYITEADIVIYITEIGKNNELFFKKIKINKFKFTIILLNKIDKYQNYILKKEIFNLKSNYPDFYILEISALLKFNINKLINLLLKKIPYHPPYYPKDIITDRSERFIVNEIIRKNILLLYNKEIPYYVNITTEFFKEEDNFLNIRSLIFVERFSHKKIIMGSNNISFNKLIKKSQIEITSFFEKKSNLLLLIKIKKIIF
ncbi:GTPase Era [Candidatus Karelsulcia muelleri]|uniref:GTPase Era n=1 Tax=Candidatus Karelsulcia muelleri TaxID=336810 RepID=UPI0035C880B6